jgi:cystathionine beta-lyase
MRYNFDEIISRKDTNAMSVDGFRDYLFANNEQLEFPCRNDELITMWIADMEFATAPEIILSIKKRLEHRILGYSRIFDSNYKESFIEWVRTKYSWEVVGEYIVTSPGVIPALYDLIDLICKPGEKVLTLTPSYAYFKHAADHNGIELVMSNLICRDGHYFIDFDDVRRKAKDKSVSLFILSSPHNPTGRLWTELELRQLGEICIENGLMVISDEIHCDLLRKGKAFTPLAKLFPQSDHIITCMSPSKTFNMAGIMLANLVIPNDELRSLWTEKHLPFENPLSIAAVQAAYTHGKEWLIELTDYLDKNFRILHDHLALNLPKAVFRIPDATYLAWIDLRAYFPDEENLTLFFANKAAVLLEGGNMFVSNSQGHIRLNLACPKIRLLEGLRRITESITANPKSHHKIPKTVL